MSLIDFVKGAGASLFGRGGDRVDPEAIAKSIAKHGVEISDLDVQVDDDVATIRGTAVNQVHREKAILVAGNTKGIARVNDKVDVAPPEPQAAPEPPSTYYEVRAGDSLSKIAKAQYGDAMKYPVIFEANQPMLKDPDKIYPGQVLRIPPLP